MLIIKYILIFDALELNARYESITKLLVMMEKISWIGCTISKDDWSIEPYFMPINADMNRDTKNDLNIM